MRVLCLKIMKHCHVCPRKSIEVPPSYHVAPIELEVLTGNLGLLSPDNVSVYLIMFSKSGNKLQRQAISEHFPKYFNYVKIPFI